MMYFQNGVGLIPSVAILYSVLHMFLQALMLHPDRLQSEQASGPKLDRGSQTRHFFRFDFRFNGPENQWISSCCIAADHLRTGFVSNTRAVHSCFNLSSTSARRSLY